MPSPSSQWNSGLGHCLGDSTTLESLQVPLLSTRRLPLWESCSTEGPPWRCPHNSALSLFLSLSPGGGWAFAQELGLNHRAWLPVNVCQIYEWMDSLTFLYLTAPLQAEKHRWWLFPSHWRDYFCIRGNLLFFPRGKHSLPHREFLLSPKQASQETQCFLIHWTSRTGNDSTWRAKRCTGEDESPPGSHCWGCESVQWVPTGIHSWRQAVRALHKM